MSGGGLGVENLVATYQSIPPIGLHLRRLICKRKIARLSGGGGQRSVLFVVPPIMIWAPKPRARRKEEGGGSVLFFAQPIRTYITFDWARHAFNWFRGGGLVVGS